MTPLLFFFTFFFFLSSPFLGLYSVDQERRFCLMDFSLQVRVISINNEVLRHIAILRQSRGLNKVFSVSPPPPIKHTESLRSAGHRGSIIPYKRLVINRQLKSTVCSLEAFSNAQMGEITVDKLIACMLLTIAFKPTFKTNVKQTRQNRSG